MPTRRTYVLRLTAEGAEKLIADLNALGDAGKRVGQDLQTAAGRGAPSLDQIAATARRARDEMEEVGRRGTVGFQAASAAADELRGRAQAAAAPLGAIGSGLQAIGPTGLAAAAGLGAVVTILGAATRAAEGTERAVRQAAVGFQAIGREVAPSTAQIRAMIAQMAALPGVTREVAEQSVVSLSRLRQASDATLAAITRQAADFAAGIGKDVPAALDALSEAVRRPAEGARSLADAYNLLTHEQVEQIETLDRQGKAYEAQRALLAAVEERTKGLAERAMTPAQKAADDLAKSWDRFKQSVGDSSWVRGATDALAWLAREAAGAVDALDGAIQNTLPKGTWAERRAATLSGWIAEQEKVVASRDAALAKLRDAGGGDDLLEVARRNAAAAAEELARMRRELDEVRARMQTGRLGARVAVGELQVAPPPLLDRDEGSGIDVGQALDAAKAYRQVAEARKEASDQVERYKAAISETVRQEQQGIISNAAARERLAELNQALAGAQAAYKAILSPAEQAAQAARIEAQVLAAPIAQREVLRARLQAEAAATAQKLTGDERARFIEAEVARAVNARAAAQREAAEATVRATETAHAETVAWQQGEVVALRIAATEQAREAVRQGTAKSVAAETAAILTRNAAEANRDLAKQVAEMEQQVAAAKLLADAELKGAAAVGEAARQEEVRKATRDANTKSAAAENEKEISTARALTRAYDAASRALAEQVRLRQAAPERRALADQLDLVKREYELLGKSNLERRTELDLLRLRQELVGKGYEGQALEDELRVRGDIVREIARTQQAIEDARGAQDHFADAVRDAARDFDRGVRRGLEDFFKGQKGSIEDWGQFFRDQIAKVAAALVQLYAIRPAIGWTLNELGFASAAAEFGYKPAGSAGGSAARGFDIPGLGQVSFGDVKTWLNTPLWNVGGTQSAGAAYYGGEAVFGPGSSGVLGAGGAPGAQGGISIAPIDILGPVASALPGLISGNYAQAALGAGGFALGNFLVPGVGGPIGAIAGNLLGGLFQKKPSNEGAEVSFNLGDWTDFFRSTKHEGRVDQVDAYTGGLQEGLRRAAQRYGVEFGDGAVVGSTFGKAEGSRFFFDAGDRDGGIENRVVAEFEAGNEAQTKAAAERVIVAAIKDGFAAAEADEGATQSARDVATAMANSFAESFADLDVDRAFAAAFADFEGLGAGTLDPVTLALNKLKQAGVASAQSVDQSAQTFYDKAIQLGLGGEQLADGTTRADAATKGYLLSLLGLEAEIDGVEGATVQAQATIEALVPVLERWGFTTEEIGAITERVMADAVAAAQAAEQAAQAAAAAAVQAAQQARLALTTSIEQAIDANYLPGVRDVFAAQGLDPAVYKTLFGAVSGALAGDADALRLVGQRLNYNADPDGDPTTNDGYLTQEQVAAISAYAIQGYQRWVQMRDAGVGGAFDPANDNDTGSGSGSGRDQEAIDRLDARLDAERDLNGILRDRVNAERRLADLFRSTADGLRQAREAFLVGSQSPLSPEEQLKEAIRQRDAAAARIAAGGDDAADAERELTVITGRIFELSNIIWGSSAQSVDVFRGGLDVLARAEDKALSWDQLHLAALNEANAELERSNLLLEQIQAELKAARAAGSGNGGNGGNGGGGVDSGSGLPPLVTPTFGVANLGRGAGESAEDFLKRLFPQVAGGPIAAGGITEAEGYAWAQAQHGSGLGLTNANYYDAAHDAGYPMDLAFGYRAHENWLNADPSGGRWRAFIDELRARVSVPYGFFGFPYAAGGEVPDVAGLTRRGVDSLPAWLTPGELVVPTTHRAPLDRILEAANDGGREMARAIADLARGQGRVEARIAMLERVMAEAAAEIRGLRGDLRIVTGNRAAAGGRR
ncbi:MAG: phage tail length tape measure family protein [Alphaproteobacteria bacterium]